MNAYICPACNRTSYSSARLEDLIDPRCPYCGEYPQFDVKEKDLCKSEIS